REQSSSATQSTTEEEDEPACVCPNLRQKQVAWASRFRAAQLHAERLVDKQIVTLAGTACLVPALWAASQLAASALRVVRRLGGGGGGKRSSQRGGSYEEQEAGTSTMLVDEEDANEKPDDLESYNDWRARGSTGSSDCSLDLQQSRGGGLLSSPSVSRPATPEKSYNTKQPDRFNFSSEEVGSVNGTGEVVDHFDFLP
ncbi:unnamed protein product, partial [Amoebophrya sp. A120]